MDAKGNYVGTLSVNPGLPSAGDWAVLSDGTLAIVRAHDYHVDFVESNGTTRSARKLPYEWMRMTDDMKQARVDSARRAIDSVRATGRPFGMTVRGRANPNGGRMLADTIIPVVSFAPLSEMADYVSLIRQGSVRADHDNNLWILPTTSGVRGGLLYDVVNRTGELFKRVQVPVDHVIVGFDKGGVIYMAKCDAATKTWVLVRARVRAMS